MPYRKIIELCEETRSETFDFSHRDLMDQIRQIEEEAIAGKESQQRLELILGEAIGALGMMYALNAGRDANLKGLDNALRIIDEGSAALGLSPVVFTIAGSGRKAN